MTYWSSTAITDVVTWFGHIFVNTLIANTFAAKRTSWSLMDAMSKTLLFFDRLYFYFTHVSRSLYFSFPAIKYAESTPTLGNPVIHEIN